MGCSNRNARAMPKAPFPGWPLFSFSADLGSICYLGPVVQQNLAGFPEASPVVNTIAKGQKYDSDADHTSILLEAWKNEEYPGLVDQ